MLFLLLRLLPAIIPILFFATAKAMFIYSSQWPWIIVAVALPPLLYFGLLKRKNPDKPVLWLAAYALVFSASGFAYSLVLESALAINFFLVGWSLVYWLYLEAVFHDFYETSKAYVFNLANITLYGNLLIIFFLTASLASFNIFLNLSWLVMLLIAAAAYFLVIYPAYRRCGLPQRQALLYAAASDLMLTEILGGLLFLPASFYFIALATVMCYYLLTQALLPSAGVLNRRRLIEILAFCGLILILAILTAAWL